MKDAVKRLAGEPLEDELSEDGPCGDQSGPSGDQSGSCGDGPCGVGPSDFGTPASVLSPPLKWAGGKRWLLPRLKALLEPYRPRRLVEPFAGGLAVALGLQPERALLNDVNPHLVNFYTQLKAGLRIVGHQENDREFFFAQRERFNELVRLGGAASTEAAELFYYLNRTAFNGLCRFNSSGEFNVPFGKYAKINYTRDFSAYAACFARWEFTCGDFTALPVAPDDVLYVDPPYDVEFTRYSPGDFVWSDQLRLVEWLAQFDCPIVASNQATERVLELYAGAGYTIERVSAPRRISCDGNREPAWEMVAMKNF